jgi:hypothetical protein
VVLAMVILELLKQVVQVVVEVADILQAVAQLESAEQEHRVKVSQVEQET